MNIQNILNNVEYIGSVKDFDVDFITDDSRKVRSGCVFICSKGLSFDGHSFAQKALDIGAKLIVCEKDLGLENQIIVKNSRQTYALMCSNLFDNPSKKLKIIGVTGTNGKTTTTFLIKDILQQQGKKVGMLGTVHNMINYQEIPAKFTTPQAFELHALLSQMYKSGCEYVVMEVSSQGLVQDRLAGITFDVGVFTNLTQDHLDYHGTMEEYFRAKSILFDNSRIKVVNIDDKYGRILKDMYQNVVSFSTKNKNADFFADNIEFTQNLTRFDLIAKNAKNKIEFPMPGEYSVHNAMTAGITCNALGFDIDVVAKALDNVRGVKGRCEILVKEPFTVIRDFAHTADGLENVLSSLKPFIKSKFVVLFGCAGNRDRTKRRPMAIAVAKYADTIIVTSDNPRSENPTQVLEDTCSYFDENNIEYTSVLDRREAINIALSKLQKDDLLIFCGKGHEDYQVLDGITVYLDEAMITQKYMEELKLKQDE